MRALICLLYVAMLCTGCIYVGRDHTPPPPPPPPPGAPPTIPEDPGTLAEIDAAVGLDFEHSRASALMAIAQRPRLHPTAQVRLVNAAYRKLDFEHSQVTLLQAIIKNPSFSNAAKQAILAQLKQLDFDHNRRAILDAISRRGALEY